MGDVRFNPYLERIKRASDRAAAIRELTDEQVVAALAAASREGEPYLANVLASAALNRVRRKATIVDAARDGMVELDADGLLVSMNPAAERLLGWTEEELRGKRASDVFHVPGGDGATDPMSAAREARPVQNEDAVFVRKDGRRLPVAYTSAPVLRDDQFEGAVVVFRDIAERKARDRLRTLRTAALQAIGGADSVEEAAQRLLEVIGETMDWQAGTFWVMAPGDLKLRPVAFWTRKGEAYPRLEAATRGAAFAPGQSMAGIVWQTEAPWWTSDFSALDAATFPRIAAAALEGLRSALAFPCPVVKRPMAAIDFFSRDPLVPDEDLLDVLAGIGSAVGQFVERRRTEQRLKESVALKNGILESALDAVVTIDHEGHVLDFNPAAVKMFGFAREEVLGRNLYESIVPERFREAHRRGMERYLQTGEAKVLGRLLELPAVRKSGEEFPTELYIVRVHGTDPPIFTSHMRDITERKRLQAELRASEQKYRKLFEFDPEAVVVSDAQRVILECNAAFTRLVGYTSDELRGQSTTALHADPASHRAVGEHFAVLGPREHFVQRVDIRTKSGHVLPTEVTFLRIDDDEDRPLAYIGRVRPLRPPS